MTWEPVGIDGVFFITIATLTFGAFGLCVKYCLKSKCEHLTLCFGLIKVDRRVDLEAQIEEKELEVRGVIDDEDDIPSTSLQSKKRPSINSIDNNFNV